MTAETNFARAGRVCVRVLTTVAALAAGIAMVTLLRTMGRADWADELPKGLLIGFPLLMATITAAHLARWSLLSHQQALDDGMLPRRASHWATWGWFLPGVQFVLPFSLLRQRFLVYRIKAHKPILWLQGLLVGTCLLWGWLLLGPIPQAQDRWSALATGATALALWRLRNLVATLHQVQSGGAKP